jgi:phosphoribosylaminoimidazole-succinocarboxamide synthase
MIVRMTQVVPIECVVRGYLDGSGWKEYHKSGTVCGISLPAGLVQCSQLPEPIFTPATKEESGHDVNISFERMIEIVGRELADDLRRRSLDVYHRAAEYARSRGIIIADTKFEWGLIGERGGVSPPVNRRAHAASDVILIDEVLTPDSSRFWPADQYEPGRPQPSFDKQYVRDWLESTRWDKNSPPPMLPDYVVAKTRGKYVEAYERLTGQTFQ